MTLDIFLDLALLPLILAAGYIALQARGGLPKGLSAAWLTGSVCVIFIAAEGFPPLPPVSAKHKIPYLLALITALACVMHLFQTKTRVALAAFALTGGFAWLVQRQLMSGTLQFHWLLPLLSIAVFANAMRDQSKTSPSIFAWPVSLLALTSTTSIVALLGGFLGGGFLMISISVCLAVILFAVFAITLCKPNSIKVTLPMMDLSTLTLSLGSLLVLISTYATNLSTSAYLLALATTAIPRAAPYIAHRPLWQQPFLFAALAAIPAVPAVVLAVLNF